MIAINQNSAGQKLYFGIIDIDDDAFTSEETLASTCAEARRKFVDHCSRKPEVFGVFKVRRVRPLDLHLRSCGLTENKCVIPRY